MYAASVHGAFIQTRVTARFSPHLVSAGTKGWLPRSCIAVRNTCVVHLTRASLALSDPLAVRSVRIWGSVSNLRSRKRSRFTRRLPVATNSHHPSIPRELRGGGREYYKTSTFAVRPGNPVERPIDSRSFNSLVSSVIKRLKKKALIARFEWSDF